MDQAAMQSKGIAPGDLLNAVAQQNVVMPSGTIKIGLNEYDVRTNGTPRTVEELSNVPLKQVNGTTIYLRDVASVSDGFQVQTNIVRQDGHRGVLVSVLKNGNSSTLDIVSGVRKLLPRVASTLPPELKMTQQILRGRGHLGICSVETGTGLQKYLNNHGPIVGSGFNMLNIIDQRSECLLIRCRKAPFELLWIQSGISPPNRNNRDIDIGENVRRCPQNNDWTQDEDEQRKNYKSVRPVQGCFYNPHIGRKSFSLELHVQRKLDWEFKPSLTLTHQPPQGFTQILRDRWR